MMDHQKRKSLETAIIDLEAYYFGSAKTGVYRFIIEETERILIEHILLKTNGNKYRTSQILGINRNTLHSKMKKLGIY